MRRLVDAEKMKTKINLGNMEVMESAIKAWIDKQETVLFVRSKTMITPLEPNRDYIIRANEHGIVEDMSELVQCKDCKYYNANCPYPMCAYHEINVKETDYCSWGIRKDEQKVD